MSSAWPGTIIGNENNTANELLNTRKDMISIVNKRTMPLSLVLGERLVRD